MRPARSAILARMSALGQKQTFAAQKGMSALPPKADIGLFHPADAVLACRLPPIIALLGSNALRVGSRWQLL